MEVTVNRLKHSYAVACCMRDIVQRHPEDYACSPEDMYILGMLHDIGYAFVEHQPDHAHAGGLALKRQGYRYWREVYYHSIPQEEYDSAELRLLNYADITTGPDGNPMAMQERIDNIILRYGKGSIQEQKAVKMRDQILSYGIRT